MMKYIKVLLFMIIVIILNGCGNNEVVVEETEEVPAINELSEIPIAIQNYQVATNTEDIEMYMSIFTEDAEMIDVSRTFNGTEEIRSWALREVIRSGDSFELIEIVDLEEGYAQTEVQWLSWRAYYYFWWNENNQITKMSLQYKD